MTNPDRWTRSRGNETLSFSIKHLTNCPKYPSITRVLPDTTIESTLIWNKSRIDRDAYI